MPSRPVVALIALFWLGTAALFLSREVLPKYLASAPPPYQIDLVDEATQQAPTRWLITPERRGSSGSLSTRMEYLAADDGFRFVNTYSQLQLDTGLQGLVIDVPSLDTAVTVTRAGQLRAQRMQGELAVKAGPVELARAKAELDGAVAGGVLRSHLTIHYPVNAKSPVIDRDLDPVAVESGQVLNPLMPVNRLRDVRPGQTWVVRESNPLGEAVSALMREFVKDKGSKLLDGVMGASGPREFLAEVARDPEWVERPKAEQVRCRRIDYRSERGAARTWVSVEDGRVMRQEATLGDIVVRFERQD